jgi:hypothetical protein
VDGFVSFTVMVKARISAALTALIQPPRLDFCSSYVLIEGMSDRPASWRMPTPKQMERLASKPGRPPNPVSPTLGPADDLPEAYWDSIVRDPRGQIRTGVPVQ